jgi:beta-glucosidase
MVHYKEGMEIGYRYTEKHQIPVQFPFGYGLSYSEFELQAASMENGKLDATVANLSDREGMAVLQVYRLADDELTYPELVAFQKVEVPAKGKINTQICVTNYDSKKTYGIGFHVGDYKMI